MPNAPPRCRRCSPTIPSGGETTARCRRSGRTRPTSTAEMAKFERRCQGRAGVGEGPRQLQGRIRRSAANMRRLPRDLPQRRTDFHGLASDHIMGGRPPDAPPLCFSEPRRPLKIPQVQRGISDAAQAHPAGLVAGVIGLACSGSSPFRRPCRRARSARLQPNLDNGKTMFYRRRLRLLPRHARPGRQDQARRRPRAEIAVRHVLVAQHLARSKRRHRQVERGAFRHRDGEGHVARRLGITSRRFPTRPISACACRTCAICSRI